MSFFVNMLVEEPVNNLLFGAKDQLKGISENFNTSNYFSPTLLLVIVFVLANVLGIILFLRWRSQVALTPNSSALFAMAADRLDVDRKDSRLLARMAREVDFEPSATLVSASMLEIMVGRWQKQFGQLSGRDQASIDRVRRAVRTAISA